MSFCLDNLSEMSESLCIDYDKGDTDKNTILIIAYNNHDYIIIIIIIFLNSICNNDDHDCNQ
jgi:hypothetical protein